MSRLRLSREGDIAVLTFDGPEAANAIDLPWARDFVDALESVEADESVRVLLIESTGRVFCAGGDVHAIAAAPDPRAYVHELATTLHAGLLLLAGWRLPVVSAVQGAAAGAGLGLVLNSDYVVASDGASFLSAYGALGVSPDAGVSWLLPVAVGPGRAAQVCLAGRRLDAKTAAMWGLVAEVVEKDGLADAARAVARRLATTPAESVAETRRLLRARTDSGYRAHLAREADSIARLFAGADSLRLQREFLERDGSTRVGDAVRAGAEG